MRIQANRGVFRRGMQGWRRVLCPASACEGHALVRLQHVGQARCGRCRTVFRVGR